MKFHTILLLGFILSSYSCENDVKEISSSEQISISSFRKSNAAIVKLSSKNYASLQDRLREEIYGQRATLCNTKALKLKSLTKDIIDQVDELNKRNHFSIDKINFLKNKYIAEIKLIDSTVNKVLNESNNGFFAEPDSDLSQAFVIEKIKNDILLLESDWSNYFNNKTAMIIEDFTVFSSIACQNAKHLKSGDTLEITTAVGAFSLATDPTFIINGKDVKPDVSATAKYSLKVSGNGRKTIPVKIFYTSNDGSKSSKELSLDYYVDQ
ncbi:MAG: hypothetical protein ABIN36_08290 [Ferruginibacter sp.]